MTKVILQAGSLAYYDSLSGPTECRVLRIWASDVSIGSNRAEIEFTPSKNPNSVWPVGTRLEVWAHHVIPRQALRIKDGKYHTADYDVIIDGAENDQDSN